MPMFQATTRPITALVGYKVSGRQVHITVEYQDGKEETLVFDAAAVPMVIAYLISGLSAAFDGLSAKEQPMVQTPQIVDFELALNENGQAAMLAHLEGGAAIPLQVTEAAVSTVQKLAEDARAYMDRQKN